VKQDQEKVESGTDTMPFSMPAFPAIKLNQDSPDYKYTHHSAADFDGVSRRVLRPPKTHVWQWPRLDRGPPPPDRFANITPIPVTCERTAKMLSEQGHYGLLKVVTFGNTEI